MTAPESITARRWTAPSAYGKPGKKPPMWLHSIMYDEMEYFNNIMHGAQPDEGV